MKYAIIKVINGNFSIDSEWGENLLGAKTAYHGACQALWNEPAVLNAYVMIADEQLDAVDGYKERIHHDPQPIVEPVAAEEA